MLHSHAPLDPTNCCSFQAGTHRWNRHLNHPDKSHLKQLPVDRHRVNAFCIKGKPKRHPTHESSRLHRLVRVPTHVSEAFGGYGKRETHPLRLMPHKSSGDSVIVPSSWAPKGKRGGHSHSEVTCTSQFGGPSPPPHSLPIKGALPF